MYPGHSVLQVPVPPLEEYVRGRTAHYDPSYLGVGPAYVHAHVTALAPFVETGAGERATDALTRSVGPKAGFMAITSYGARGVGRIDLDLGMRYRDPEQLAGVTLRNELFYKALVTADLNRTVGLFAGGEGRRLGRLELARQRRARAARPGGEAAFA